VAAGFLGAESRRGRVETALERIASCAPGDSVAEAGANKSIIGFAAIEECCAASKPKATIAVISAKLRPPALVGFFSASRRPTHHMCRERISMLRARSFHRAASGLCLMVIGGQMEMTAECP